MWHENQACHTHFHFELKTAGIPSVLQLEKCLENKKSAKLKNNLGHFLNFGFILNGFRNISPNAIFTVKLGLQWAILRLNGTKLPTGVLTFTVKIAFGEIFRKPFKIEPRFKKWPNFFFLILHFFCFLNIFLAAKLTECWLFWVQNENGHGKLDFCATTLFFSTINTTFLDVWMIFIGLFDSSIGFRFQNFFGADFSRYWELYV